MRASVRAFNKYDVRNMSFDREQILDLFVLLNAELTRCDIVGELYLVGGAVMCLSMNARPSTNDVDAYFRPAADVRQAAKRVAQKAGVAEDWLNDAVKGYLDSKGRYDLYLAHDHLKVYVALPEYLLALKAAAMRIGPGFEDENDVRFLLRYLNIVDYKTALATITQYVDLKQLPQKTLYALEEMLGPTA